jgi:hypothetical protein
VQLTVVNHRTDILPFYEKRGFVRVGEKPFKQHLTSPDDDLLSRPSHFIVMRRKATGQDHI